MPLIVLLAAAQLSAGQEPPVKVYPPISLPVPGTVASFVEENDKFAPKNEDRYYTQGMRVYFNSDEHHYWALTQEINTPSDTATDIPSQDDLPYSGALYLTYGFGTILDRGGRRDCLFSSELQFGVIGPASGAKNIQNKFHDLINVNRPAGWATQLPNEPALNLNLEFKRRFTLDGPHETLRDIIAHGQVQLGTLRTEVALGAQYRWGWGLDASWGQGTIRHANAYKPVQSLDPASGDFPVAGWFFLDAQTEVVIRNYATDGTNFVYSRSVTRRPIVLQLMGGISFHFRHTEVTYFVSMRTKEFETQQSVHCFGGIKGDIKF